MPPSGRGTDAEDSARSPASPASRVGAGSDTAGNATHRRIIAAGLSPAVPGTLTMGALKALRILQPVHARFSIQSPVLAVGSSRRSCTGWFTRLFAVAAKRLQSGCPDTPTCSNMLIGLVAVIAVVTALGLLRRVAQKQAVQNGQSQCHPS